MTGILVVVVVDGRAGRFRSECRIGPRRWREHLVGPAHDGPPQGHQLALRYLHFRNEFMTIGQNKRIMKRLTHSSTDFDDGTRLEEDEDVAL